MSRRGGRGNFRGGRQHSSNTSYDPPANKRSRQISPEIQTVFESFRSEIDNKNDKWERLVKHSRDITIESKRVIFLLHRITQNDASVLQEADERLAMLRKTKFAPIAEELQNEDSNCYVGSFRPGLQEYIEAASLLHYLRTSALLDYQSVQESLSNLSTGGDGNQSSVKVEVSLADYLCGIGDLSGELMRLAINYVSAGDFRRPVEICTFLSEMHRGFALLGHGLGSRDFNFKLRVAKQNLQKVENACYVLKLRGTEAPDYMLAEIMASFLSTGGNDGGPQYDQSEADMGD